MKLRIKFKSRPRRFLHRTESCLNCEHHLDISDGFCSYCGQKNSSKPLNLKELLVEFFSGLISYDSRFRKTISALVFRPGKLSKEYIQGKRIKYVNPFRFFISTAIIFFLAISWINRDDLKELKSTLEDERIENNENFNYEFDFEKNSTAFKIADFIRANPRTNYTEAIDSLGIEETIMNQLKFNFLFGYTRLKENPIGFLNFLLPKLPFFLFFFVPIFTIFSSLFYIRRKIPYTHHLIFNYNQQTVFLILLFLAIILSFASLWFLLLYVFYLYKSMRKFYNQSRIKTMSKQFIIINFYWISALFVLSSLSILSIVFF
ncbi:hypothetical protein P700755_002199 [Psychroflexus torquis ATCC 700755]|uniref:DUF3667 domain-containing protein n=1 Tax=Psychroflexus torquis (strain ATCC 700755 / CIP 106069 / ACAM 623) TaxID=313595 RepID=K4IF42_PSYTT|nr:DUF3667 domain-containing protein [Psychroflexus torquis]AFU68989.1 hypothetical protein P700755_002199 [Psychroflexus torquis ATCC 700755]